MGRILNLKTLNNDKVQITLEVSKQDAEKLKGKMDKMHLFSEENLEMTARLVQRGKKESTKYFLLPKDHKKGILVSNEIKCNVIETQTKKIFIFSTNKY